MLRDLVAAAPGRVHHAVYDRLMGSRQMTNLMTLGVVPIVEMKSTKGSRYLDLPKDMWIYKGNPDRPGRTKKGNKKKTLVKKKVHLALIDVVPCDSDGGVGVRRVLGDRRSPCDGRAGREADPRCRGEV